MSPSRREPFEFGGEVIAAGQRMQIEIPIARLMSGTPVAIPVVVYHGVDDGPTVWVNAAIHGDEIGGVDIILRVMGGLDPRSMAGTLIVVPIVNVHGFNRGDRYLPDRRDLNRSFPGSARGSLAARIAHLMMTEIVARCSVGIDLHTGSDNRSNLPQIRADLDDATTLELARSFAAPITIHAPNRSGSLRHAATGAGATVLLFEGGQALRFDRAAIDAGTAGVIRVLGHLGIIDADDAGPPTSISRSTRWERAPRSGIAHLDHELGDEVEEGEKVATVFDPFGEQLGVVTSRTSGVVIGQTRYPLVNRGDAIVHIAAIG